MPAFTPRKCMSSCSAASRLLSHTLTPFLYPSLHPTSCTATRHLRPQARKPRPRTTPVTARRRQTTAAQDSRPSDPPPVDATQYDLLNPNPRDYSDTPITDSCTLTLHAGQGGHGCISFLREKYVANGPANGGDGGTGGSIYIQAVRGETSLHKLARRGVLAAARGKNGQGSLKGGARGEDVLLNVPVGTVVRELWRHDPLEAEEDEHSRSSKGYGRDVKDDDETADAPHHSRQWRRDKWLLYSAGLPRHFTAADFPALPRPRRSNLSTTQPPAPLRLDLDTPMETPLLLAAGASGGLGNPHFVTRSLSRPKFATKGDDALRIALQLELKLLADVGLVGLPNAGKSTLLRALTASRARVGNWAFTTLSPNIGTVVLDSHTGRPALPTTQTSSSSVGKKPEPRTNFTIADIPGLIEGAHLDRGLGLGFLRHIERAAVLAFVVDLSAGDAVAALKALWREVGMYEALREREVNADTERTAPDEQGLISFKPFPSRVEPVLDEQPVPHRDQDAQLLLHPPPGRPLPALSLPPISSKPWFVVATKADLDGTRANFQLLQQYLAAVQTGAEAHPCRKRNAWCKTLRAVPVSAMRREGVEGIPAWVVELLNA